MQASLAQKTSSIRRVSLLFPCITRRPKWLTLFCFFFAEESVFVQSVSQNKEDKARAVFITISFSQDNLRKHVIKSKLHPGKSVYECHENECDFTANFSKDFKTHLVQKHRMRMSDAVAQAAGIYKPMFDAQADKVISGEPGDATEGDDEPMSPGVVEEETLEEFIYDEDVDDRLPTLASVALTPSKTNNDEEIVFIHVESSDEKTHLELIHQPTLSRIGEYAKNRNSRLSQSKEPVVPNSGELYGESPDHT
ncbi:unnamed protein product, partial [Nesidiocoris tenuis]